MRLECCSILHCWGTLEEPSWGTCGNLFIRQHVLREICFMPYCFWTMMVKAASREEQKRSLYFPETFRLLCYHLDLPPCFSAESHCQCSNFLPNILAAYAAICQYLLIALEENPEVQLTAVVEFWGSSQWRCRVWCWIRLDVTCR